MRWVDRVGNWAANRTLAAEKEPLTGSLLIRMALSVAVIVGCSFLLRGDGMLSLLAGLVVFGAAGYACAIPLKRRLAYRNGWIDGRKEAWDSMVEAHKRGMTVDEWFYAEIEKDMAHLGLPPPPRD